MADWRGTLPDIGPGAAIPRILHQHFLAGEAAIPPRVRPIRDALRAANPGWCYSFWDAARAEAFIGAAYGPAILARYLRIAPEYYAARSDLLRYLALYVQGGVYLDIKSTCDRPLDAAVAAGDQFLLMHFPHMMAGARTPEAAAFAQDHLAELAGFPNGEYVQWVIAAVPGHPFLRAAIKRVLENIDGYSPLRVGVGGAGTLRVTGPVAYTLAIERIRPDHPHTGPMSAADRGFVYSALETMAEHRTAFGTSVYYQNLATPIVRVSRATRLAARAAKWAMRFPAFARAARRLRSALARRVT